MVLLLLRISVLLRLALFNGRTELVYLFLRVVNIESHHCILIFQLFEVFHHFNFVGSAAKASTSVFAFFAVVGEFAVLPG